ncbi:MAG: lysophospholipid acyltransferase family protein [Myxococcota bacterium]
MNYPPEDERFSWRSDESFWRRWSRRITSISVVFTTTLVVTVLWPAALPLVLFLDARSGRASGLRALLLCSAFLWIEIAGITTALVLGFLGMLRLLRDSRYQDAHYRLQRWWAAALFKTLSYLLCWELEFDGPDSLAQGPLLILSRHASIIDTLLPAVLLGRIGYQPRYVMKRALLWDPCLDLVGQRLPNAFVTRGGKHPELEAKRIAALGQDVTQMDAIVLYPEGTRFTPERRNRHIAALRRSDDPRLPVAETLQHTLVPRARGIEAVTSTLRQAPSAAVVLFEHTGLEGLTGARDLLTSAAFGRRITLRLRTFPLADVPVGPELERWLHMRWQEMDAWIARILR